MLDAKEVLLIFGGTSLTSSIITVIVNAVTQAPSWLLVLLFVGVAIVLFMGLGYVMSGIKKHKQQRIKAPTISAKVMSINQQGGQTADTIHNIGTQEKPHDKEI